MRSKKRAIEISGPVEGRPSRSQRRRRIRKSQRGIAAEQERQGPRSRALELGQGLRGNCRQSRPLCSLQRPSRRRGGRNIFRRGRPAGTASSRRSQGFSSCWRNRSGRRKDGPLALSPELGAKEGAAQGSSRSDQGKQARNAKLRLSLIRLSSPVDDSTEAGAGGAVKSLQAEGRPDRHQIFSSGEVTRETLQDK